MLFGQKLRLGLTKAHCSALTAALHAVHHVNPDTDQQDHWRNCEKEAGETRLFLCLCDDGNVLCQKHIGDFRVPRHDCDIVLAIRAAVSDLLAIKRGLRDIAALDCRDKLGIAFGVAHRVFGIAAEQIEQRKHQQEQDDPEYDVTCVAQGDTP